MSKALSVGNSIDNVLKGGQAWKQGDQLGAIAAVQGRSDGDLDQGEGGMVRLIFFRYRLYCKDTLCYERKGEKSCITLRDLI